MAKSTDWGTTRGKRLFSTSIPRTILRGAPRKHAPFAILNRYLTAWMWSFIRDFGLPFVLLSDPDTSMMQAYGAYGEKTQYGKKSMGTIRSTVVIGPEGKVVKHWKKVAKAETHPGDVLEFLKKLAEKK